MSEKLPIPASEQARFPRKYQDLEQRDILLLLSQKLSAATEKDALETELRMEEVYLVLKGSQTFVMDAEISRQLQGLNLTAWWVILIYF